MLRYIKNKINFAGIKKMNSEYQAFDNNKYEVPISTNLNSNLSILKNILNSSSDVIFHEFSFGSNRQSNGLLIYISGMVNKNIINHNILEPLMYNTLVLESNVSMDLSNMNTIVKSILIESDTSTISTIRELLDDLLSGNAILFIDNSSEALSINAKKWEHRTVDMPLTENGVRGSREGFTENLQVNTTLLRAIIKAPDLCIESLKIGDITRTEVSIVYIKTIANPELVKEVTARLKKIHVDAILESGYIEQFIEDTHFSIFSTVANSEKPDKVAGKILEGRVAIFINGSPFVLTVPMLFVESFQSREDYYSRPFFASVIRLIRFISYMISVLAPATYVALTIFHQELIPTPLLISIVAGHESVPFPAVLEAAFMVLTFDILREAGVRLPQPVGSAISIVGALVIGQSAVAAGLISPIMVIVVSFTAITSFVVPPQTDSGALLRYILLALAGIAGGFGILMGLLVTLIHLSCLESFGTPYLWPIVPFSLSGWKDVFIRGTMKTHSQPLPANILHTKKENSIPLTADKNITDDKEHNPYAK